MDDWNVSPNAPPVTERATPNHPRPMTAALTPARSFMDDNPPTFIETSSSSRATTDRGSVGRLAASVSIGL
jgi:hypothetical protein